MLTVHFSHLKKGNNNLRGIPHIHILIRQRQGHNHGVLNVTKVFKYTGFFQCWESVTFWSGSGSADSYLWLTDPDPTPFFSDFKDANNHYFHVTYPQYSVFSLSGLKIYFFAKILFCKRYFSPLNTSPLTNGSGSGRSKNMRILLIRIQIPNTVFLLIQLHSQSKK